ncbi:MAG: tyrosine-type recombinase/integrase [Bacilli bacterium]
MCHYSQANRSFYRRRAARCNAPRHGRSLTTRRARSGLRSGSVRIHSMRKTFGRMAFESGVDVTRIQKLLNHSTPSITLAYIGIMKEELDNVYLTLEL